MSDKIIPLIVVAAGAAAAMLWLSKCELICENCGARFSLPLAQMIFAPKMMFKKLVTCPVCGRKTWADVVIKNRR